MEQLLINLKGKIDEDIRMTLLNQLNVDLIKDLPHSQIESGKLIPNEEDEYHRFGIEVFREEPEFIDDSFIKIMPKNLSKTVYDEEGKCWKVDKTMFDGFLHSYDDKPSQVTVDSFWKSSKWHEYGLLSRDNGPAILEIAKSDDINSGGKCDTYNTYIKNGRYSTVFPNQVSLSKTDNVTIVTREHIAPGSLYDCNNFKSERTIELIKVKASNGSENLTGKCEIEIVKDKLKSINCTVSNGIFNEQCFYGHQDKKGFSIVINLSVEQPLKDLFKKEISESLTLKECFNLKGKEPPFDYSIMFEK